MKYFQCRIAFIAFVIFTGINLAGCKKSDDGEPITIDGFTLTNPNGDHYGYHGPVDQDWTFGNGLTAKELELFNFPVTVTLDNTKEVAVNGNLIAYPNPMKETQSYHIAVSDSVIVKLVVVNSKRQVLYRTAVKVNGKADFRISYGDRSIFPDKSAVRIYYSVSALNKPNYKTGYGDIKVCDDSSGNCF